MCETIKTLISTSFWMVNETRNRLECGSVQMKWASVNRTLFRPFNFFRHIARSSWDSGLARVHACGGERNRSQFRQNETDAIDHTANHRQINPNWKHNWHTLLRNSFCYINPKILFGMRTWKCRSYSTHVFLRHATHRLAEFGVIGVPQSAQSTRWTAGAGTNSIEASW